MHTDSLGNELHGHQVPRSQQRMHAQRLGCRCCQTCGPQAVGQRGRHLDKLILGGGGGDGGNEHDDDCTCLPLCAVADAKERRCKSFLRSESPIACFGEMSVSTMAPCHIEKQQRAEVDSGNGMSDIGQASVARFVFSSILLSITDTLQVYHNLTYTHRTPLYCFSGARNLVISQTFQHQRAMHLITSHTCIMLDAQKHTP